MLKELKKRNDRDLHSDQDDESFSALPISSEEGYHVFKNQLMEDNNLKRKLVSTCKRAFMNAIMLFMNILYRLNRPYVRISLYRVRGFGWLHFYTSQHVD